MSLEQADRPSAIAAEASKEKLELPLERRARARITHHSTRTLDSDNAQFRLRRGLCLPIPPSRLVEEQSGGFAAERSRRMIARVIRSGAPMSTELKMLAWTAGLTLVL